MKKDEIYVGTRDELLQYFSDSDIVFPDYNDSLNIEKQLDKIDHLGMIFGMKRGTKRYKSGQEVDHTEIIRFYIHIREDNFGHVAERQTLAE